MKQKPASIESLLAWNKVSGIYNKPGLSVKSLNTDRLV